MRLIVPMAMGLNGQKGQNKMSKDRILVAGESFELSELGAVLKTLKIKTEWQLLPELKTPPEADMYALLLDKNNIAPTNEDFIFFNQLESQDNAVYLMNEDNTAIQNGGEQSIMVNLEALRYDIVAIKIGMNIYRGGERDQSFRFLEAAQLSLFNHDDEAKPLAHMRIKGEDFKDTVCMVMLYITRSATGWNVAPMTEEIHNFAELARSHGIVVAG